MGDLIARLESGEGSPFNNLEEADAFTRSVFGPSWTFADQGLLTDACNGSLDRAVAFVERMLPGYWHGYTRYSALAEAHVSRAENNNGHFYGRSPSPARALMAAALRALSVSPTPAPKEDA